MNNVIDGLNQGYQLNDREEYFDTAKGEVVDQKDLTPWEIIKATAARFGYNIHDPKKGCKSCCGRGYIGFMANTKQPIPCNCIYTAEQLKNNQISPTFNRKLKRSKVFRNEIKNRVKNLRKLQELGILNQTSVPANSGDENVKN